MKIYKYVGDGVGVPGLPHQISEDEAKQLGVSEILKDAITAGNYELETTKKKPKEVADG